MSNNNALPLDIDDAMLFIQYAVRKFPGIWNSKSSNASGMKAAFRRWHPDSPPSPEMRQHIWDLIFRAMYEADDMELNGKQITVAKMKSILSGHTDASGYISGALAELVDSIAAIVSLRAVAGEQEQAAQADGEAQGDNTHNGATQNDQQNSAEIPAEQADTPAQQAHTRRRHRSIGHALQDAEMTDLRLMRLMTTPGTGRLEALHRALRLINAKSAHFDWVWQETHRIVLFLFGTEEDAQKSINHWTADFLAARAREEAASEATS